uniref:Uncharacterized protein n=1 Tax=Rhizophagus irregularis (strain DAOM 181602 / DAOM 197198 / MUCL 43194) TaxID=747089 RepID=U9TSE7_RHIID
MPAKSHIKRKFRAADSIEYILHSSNLNEGVDEEFLNEWFPAESRMRFIEGNNYDVYGVSFLDLLVEFCGSYLYQLLLF